MGLYRTICYKVEDEFVKILTRKQDPTIIRERVLAYRSEQESSRKNKEQKQ
ncbi:hypothetical protein [Ectobacillus sp. sgz5001026]|uniref:hypothetical protein n=1 Tax=Ectobacillus sp. sgz5001026 TaxID=3242473 RepID=UPI0036D22D80